MPQPVARRFLKDSTEPSVEDKNSGQPTELTSFKRRNVHAPRLTVHQCNELKRFKDAVPSLWEDFSGASKQAKIVGKLPEKSTLKPLTAELLKPRNIAVAKFAKHGFDIERKKSRSPIMVADIQQRQNMISGSFSSIVSDGRVYRARKQARVGKSSDKSGEEVNRLSHVAELHLFQTLANESLPFLELHTRLGVSRRTVKGFVNKGLFTELWGEDSVGMRYGLSEKGKVRLDELQKSATYRSSVSEKRLIRLKNIWT